MTESDYNEKLKKIEADYATAKKNLYVEYAKSQAIYKKGDIIKDHRCTIRIDKITAYKSYGLPEPVYSGAELKKDLTPKANGNTCSIYGNKGIVLVKSSS